MNKLNIVLIAFSLTMIFAKIQQDPFTSGWTTFSQDLISIDFVIIFSLLLFAVFYLIRLAINSQRTLYKVLFLIFAMLLATAFIFQIHFQPDDEILISLFSYQSIIHGVNPYTQNYTSQLLPALSLNRVGATYLQNGAVVGTYGYPFLYLLVQMPFFWLFNPSPITIANLAMPVEYSVFFAFFILVCYLLFKEKYNQLPVYSAVILTSMIFLLFSSISILLMLSFILLLYTHIGNRLSWLILGLMASLQQELWIICLLFIVFEYKERGFTYAWSNAFMALFVFIIINIYPILNSPMAFAGNFIQVTSLAPNNVAPLAGLLLIFNTPTWILTLLVILSIFAIAFVVYKYAEKRFIPLLSAVPFLWISHSLPIYFCLPFAAFCLVSW